MRKIITPLLLAVIAILAVAMIYQNRVMTELVERAGSDDEIVRVYVGLSSAKLSAEFRLEDVEKIVGSRFDGAAIVASHGLYKGVSEESLIINLINCCSWKVPKAEFRQNVEGLAVELRERLGQETVLVEQLSYGNIGAQEF